MPPFVACPSCACPAKSSESDCPSCGTALRGADGRIARTAIAVLLGLTGAAALGGCSGGGASAPKYGVPGTVGPEPDPTVTTVPSSEPPPEMAPKYGVPATPQPRDPEAAPMYGIPATLNRN
jgi:hypothetical protein